MHYFHQNILFYFQENGTFQKDSNCVFVLVDITIPIRLSLILDNLKTRLQNNEGNSLGNNFTAKILEWKIFQT